LGQRFGRLTVVSRAENTKAGQARWECICKCGKNTVVVSQYLRGSKIKSCGCLRKEKLKTGTIKHGESKTRLYGIWETIKRRLNEKKRKDYRHYGGRGILICDDWKNDFRSFRNWALSNGYRDNLTIDRIDNNKGYFPANCRWVDMKTQANNKRTNRYITYNGKTKTFAEWGQEIGGSATLIRDRIDKLGWSIEKALTTPVKRKK